MHDKVVEILYIMHTDETYTFLKTTVMSETRNL